MRAMRGLRHGALRVALCAVLLASCGETNPRPGAPLILAATPGNASARIMFAPPRRSGQSPVSAYFASCSSAGETRTAMAGSSTVQVSGLANGVTYDCAVAASNSAGTGAPSSAVTVTPRAAASVSLAAGYRSARWAAGVSVTFPSECTMTVWPSARPGHRVDMVYLAPPLEGAAPTALSPVARTAVSQMPLVVTPYEGDGAQTPVSIDICPSRALVTTPVNAGVIGILISGSVLYRAAEIQGHRATSLNDNVSRTWRAANGEQITARFIDECNGHPTPVGAGNVYHYHGHSRCVTAMVDAPDSASHLIGVALDGFPIYGDRDIDGKVVAASRLDACNGITSPTPEFPEGVYHYVLPAGVREHNASMRCYAGTVPQRVLAAAEAGGFCYSPRQSGTVVSSMTMRPAPAR